MYDEGFSEAFNQDFRTGILSLTNPNTGWIDEEKAKERFSICKGCPELIKLTTQCKKCGCFMKIKTKIELATCPIGKW